MPRGVYERKKKTAGTAVEKVKKVYRTKTKTAEKLASTNVGTTSRSISQDVQDLNQLMAYLHTLVVSKTQGVRSAVLDGEINDVIVLLKGKREAIYGQVGTTTNATAPAAVTAGAVIQEVAPEVPQQAVFTPPA